MADISSFLFWTSGDVCLGFNASMDLPTFLLHCPSMINSSDLHLVHLPTSWPASLPSLFYLLSQLLFSSGNGTRTRAANVQQTGALRASIDDRSKRETHYWTGQYQGSGTVPHAGLSLAVLGKWRFGHFSDRYIRSIVSIWIRIQFFEGVSTV